MMTSAAAAIAGLMIAVRFYFASLCAQVHMCLCLCLCVRVHLHASKLIVSKFIAYFLAAHLLRLLRFPGRAAVVGSCYCCCCCLGIAEPFKQPLNATAF